MCIRDRCKGSIKKEFLSEIIDFIGQNYNELDVIYLPEPSIQFLDLQSSEGQKIDIENGDVPPIGVAFNVRWAISNEGTRSFTPEKIMIQNNNQWESVCDPLETFEPLEIKIANCFLTIPITMQAGNIEIINFILEFEDDYIVNSTYNLTIPQEFKLDWVDVSIPLAEYNKVSTVEFEVTNLGNEKISDKLEIVLPNGWDSQFEDTNWIVLDPGESRRVSFELTPVSYTHMKLPTKA